MPGAFALPMGGITAELEKYELVDVRRRDSRGVTNEAGEGAKDKSFQDFPKRAAAASHWMARQEDAQDFHASQ